MHTELTNQAEVFAIVNGQELTQVPADLFIPPHALEVLLDSFSGPLDLLLYLIRKQNIDILNIPIVTITQQYLHYIQLMECRHLELAADYLLMAALLAEIKSRLLLPVPPGVDEEELEDPRMALVRRLQAYEQIKQGTELLDALPRQERDTYLIQILPDTLDSIKAYPQVQLASLVEVMRSLLEREEHQAHHEVFREPMSVRERMSGILLQLQEHKTMEFVSLIRFEEGRRGLVITLLAVLELAKQSLVWITQAQSFSPIYLQAA